jgi:hypothetical protein
MGIKFFVQCENQVDFDVKLYKNSHVKIQNFLNANGFKLPYKLASQVENFCNLQVCLGLPTPYF